MRGFVFLFKSKFILSRGFKLSSERGQGLLLLFYTCQLALRLGDLFEDRFDTVENEEELADKI